MLQNLQTVGSVNVRHSNTLIISDQDSPLDATSSPSFQVACGSHYFKGLSKRLCRLHGLRTLNLRPMDGLGQLFVGPNGSVYALVPAAEREPVQRQPRIAANEHEVTEALLAQYLQRQQQQQGQHLRQQQYTLQLEGLASPHIAPQREDALHNLLRASLVQNYQAPSGNDLGPPNLNPVVFQGPSASNRRRPPSVESPSNSESESPPPSARGADRSERSNQNGLTVSAPLSAKEKNRQAQRRFRERQKDLIANLKQRVESLQTKLTESEKEIIALKEENAMLRGRVEGKQQMSSVTLPAEALQSLLQMTAANGLLTDAGAVGGAGRVSNGQGQRGGRRSGDLRFRGDEGL